MEIAVVVVTHDSQEHVRLMLASLVAQLQTGDELVVVDNASQDRTREFAGGVPGARLIDNPRNAGYGAGCALGAAATTAPLLLFLNPDCQLEPGSLELLRAASWRHPEWAAWQPVVLLPDGRVNSSGGIVHYTGVGWAGDFGRMPHELSGGDRTTTFPCGAAMAVRREAWEQIGGFEPGFFLYCEDLDFGLRLWLAGREVGVVGGAHATHDYDFDRTAQKRFWLERNRWLTVLAVYPPGLLLLVLPAMVAAEMVIVLDAARHGWLGTKLRAQFATLRGLPQTVRRRRRIQALRRCETHRFAALLVSHLDSPFLNDASQSWLGAAQARLWLLLSALLGRGAARSPLNRSGGT